MEYCMLLYVNKLLSLFYVNSLWNGSEALRQFILLFHSNHRKIIFVVTLFLFHFISQLPVEVVQLKNTFSLYCSLTNRTLFPCPLVPGSGDETREMLFSAQLSLLKPFSLCVLHKWHFCVASIECLGTAAFSFLLFFIDGKKRKRILFPPAFEETKLEGKKAVRRWGTAKCCNTVPRVLCLVLLWQNSKVFVEVIVKIVCKSQYEKGHLCQNCSGEGFGMGSVDQCWLWI